MSGWVIKNQQSFASANLKSDPRFARNLFENTPLQSVLAVPLRVEGITLGALILLNISQPSATSRSAAETPPHPDDQHLEQSLSYLEKFATIAAPFLRNVQKIQQYFEAPVPEATLLAKHEAVGLLGKSRKFIELLQAIEAAARCDVRVLLEGQSGTGKELVARAIHHFSARSGHPFVAIDCGAISENLIESELFGHVKGAFTSANNDRKGLLEEADGGALFMDEIANLPLEMQTKLMRVLQAGEVRPLGSNKTRKVDACIIAASSASLRQRVHEQKFREDMFYRLHVYPIHVPSLDDRQEDIPLLANHFLQRFASQQQKQAALFHEEILDFLYEEQVIRNALVAGNWNIAKTARALRIAEQTLRYKMGKLGIVKVKT